MSDVVCMWYELCMWWVTIRQTGVRVERATTHNKVIINNCTTTNSNRTAEIHNRSREVVCV